MGERGSEIDVSKVQLCMAITKVGKVRYFTSGQQSPAYSSGIT